MKLILTFILFAILTACTQDGKQSPATGVEILECWDQQDVKTFKEQARLWYRAESGWQSSGPYGSYTPKQGERCVVQS